MPTLAAAQPLISLDAVALDTETTALDVHRARVLQIGSVRIERGRLRPEATFSSLVDPGIPVPAVSTAIHGIDAAALRDAPGFAEAYQGWRAFAGDTVVIGHSLGFDLAVLQQECRNAGLRWSMPRVLDTSLLAQVANPALPDASLDTVAAWLDVEMTDRHTALGDAFTAARVFLALRPALRERNIRTLAEAEAACRRLTRVLEDQYKAGWVEPVAVPPRDAEAAARIDSYPYRHRVRDVMRSPAAHIERGTSLGSAAQRMMQFGV
ncbi:MAG: 3'-5' exonuclease, partial [Pseudomonadota bacterium]|nr:3'-5' exonuclease [Pseudomonadota bacterium]